MKFILISPSDSTTGGIESMHQFGRAIKDLGLQCEVFYVGKTNKAQEYFIDAALQAKVDDNMPNQYNAIYGILEVAKKNEDSRMINEFSDEIQSLFRKDQARGHKFKHLITSLDACIVFSSEAKELVNLSKDI